LACLPFGVVGALALASAFGVVGVLAGFLDSTFSTIFGASLTGDGSDGASVFGASSIFSATTSFFSSSLTGAVSAGFGSALVSFFSFSFFCSSGFGFG